eukprot:1703662-Rhodomonas_salina.1
MSSFAHDLPTLSLVHRRPYTLVEWAATEVHKLYLSKVETNPDLAAGQENDGGLQREGAAGCYQARRSLRIPAAQAFSAQVCMRRKGHADYWPHDKSPA